MKNKIIIYSLLSCFLLVFPMSYALSTESYDNVTLSFNQSRQPSTSERVWVLATVRIDTPVSASGQVARIDFQISPNNATWETIPTGRSGGDIAALATLQTYSDQELIAIVPIGYFYRLILTNESGTPMSSIIRIKEILTDKPAVDPLTVSCDEDSTSLSVQCTAMATYLNATPFSTTAINYTILFPNLSVQSIGRPTEINGFNGVYNFSFTTATTGTHRVIVNTTIANQSYRDAENKYVTTSYLNSTEQTFFSNLITNIKEAIWSFLFDNGKTAEQTILDIENNTQSINMSLTNVTISIDPELITSKVIERLCVVARPICQDEFRRHYRRLLS